MKIVFIGCVEIGLKCLKCILKDNWEVEAIFTLAKKYAKKTSGFVDFSSIAKRHKISLYKIKDINEYINIFRIKKINPDLIIICGWQRLVCEEILAAPRLGTIGFHSSLLPKYRGRAPVNWAIINGEKKTGITMFYCNSQADTGDIIAQRSFPITPADTCLTVYDKAAKAACQLLHKYLILIKKGTIETRKNKSNRFPFWPKRKPGDGLINWNQEGYKIHNWIRGLTHPYPGAFTYYKEKKYFIWESKISRKKIDTRYKPGEIIMVSKKNQKPLILVATRDKPIWIYNIIKERGKIKNIFTKRASFI